MVSRDIERAIDDFVAAIRNVDDAECIGRNAHAEALKQHGGKRAALIALLARDDARIARLEDVAEIARDFADVTGPLDRTETCFNLRHALQALDDTKVRR